MTALAFRIRQGFLHSGLPTDLVDELLLAFAEAKQRFHRGDLRPSELEGARFAEVVFRILQWSTSNSYTPIGRTLPNVATLMATFEQATTTPDSIRLHIPRTLRLIYDVRNKRDVAHLGDGIDPNLQDASMVVSNIDWVLAELVRIFHKVSAEEAHRIIVELATKTVPLIRDFDGFPRLLRNLKASDYVSVLLYWRGVDGATLDELRQWVRPQMRANLIRTLRGLDAKNLVHLNGSRYVLTNLGIRDTEQRNLLQPATAA